MEHFNKTWSTGKGNGKPLQYSYFENSMNSKKGKKILYWKMSTPRSVGVQYATGEQQRNSSRKNEETGPKEKHPLVVYVSGGESKVQCCKEHYCIGTWNARPMNQGNLDMVKQEMARVNITILGINELKWTGMGEFNSDDHYIYYWGQEFLRVCNFHSQQKGLKWSTWVQSQKQLNDLGLFPRQTTRPFRYNLNQILYDYRVVQFSSVQFTRSVMSDSLRHHESQHTRSSCPSPTSRVHSNSCPLSRWCHPAISSSVIPFSSCPQSLPASESFPMSQLFASGGQSTGVSALASVLPMNTQDWSPLEWTSWISLQSKGLSRVFSNTTVQKHQFGAQLSSSRILPSF